MKAKSCVLLILLALSIECFLLGRAHGQSTETPSPVNPTLTCAPAPCVLPLPLLPTGFTYNGNSVVINADKQSNIYVTNQNHLGGYNASGGNNIETVLTPCDIGAHGGAGEPEQAQQPADTKSNPQDCDGDHFTNNPAALHAFCAAAIPGSETPCPSAMTELYSSRTPLQTAIIHSVHGFPTPTIFGGQVYMGTDTEVDVFGICSTAPTGVCVQ